MPRFDSRLGCSTISFRHQPLPEALATIAGLGFTEIDLGALPGVCDHVPYVLDMTAVEDVARTVIASGLQVRSINGDIGDLNVPLADGPRPAARATSTCSSRSPSQLTHGRSCCPAGQPTTRRSKLSRLTSRGSPTNSPRRPNVAAPRGVAAVDRIAAPDIGCAGTSNVRSC